MTIISALIWQRQSNGSYQVLVPQRPHPSWTATILDVTDDGTKFVGFVVNSDVTDTNSPWYPALWHGTTLQLLAPVEGTSYSWASSMSQDGSIIYGLDAQDVFTEVPVMSKVLRWTNNGTSVERMPPPSGYGGTDAAVSRAANIGNFGQSFVRNCSNDGRTYIGMGWDTGSLPTVSTGWTDNVQTALSIIPSGTNPNARTNCCSADGSVICDNVVNGSSDSRITWPRYWKNGVLYPLNIYTDTGSVLPSCEIIGCAADGSYVFGNGIIWDNILTTTTNGSNGTMYGRRRDLDVPTGGFIQNITGMSDSARVLTGSVFIGGTFSHACKWVDTAITVFSTEGVAEGCTGDGSVICGEDQANQFPCYWVSDNVQHNLPVASPFFHSGVAVSGNADGSVLWGYGEVDESKAWMITSGYITT